MEKYFLEIIHDGGILDGESLDMLKGGKGDVSGCTIYIVPWCPCNGKGATYCSTNKMG